MTDICALIADDVFAASFQSLGQYRTALLAALAQPEPVALSPKEVEAQEAFLQLRDKILHLSDGLEVNEVLGIYASDFRS